MVISEKKVVSLTYELRKDSQQGEIIETVNDSRPLTFISGVGNLLPKFEKNLEGLKVGDSFSFRLTADEAYGPKNPDAVVDVPISVFMVDGALDEELVQIGNTIPMRDQEGRRLNGVVKEVNPEFVRMDFNHPLAGDSLFFSGMVQSVREASSEELAHGHVHSHGDEHDHGCGEHDCEGCGGSCS